MAQPGQRPAGRIYGIETRAELVEKSRALAERLGFDHMAFLNLKVAQATRSAELPAQVDIVTALHACDTATDDAIAFGLQKQARHMVLVPCCQAEVAAVLRKNKALSLAKTPLGRLGSSLAIIQIPSKHAAIRGMANHMTFLIPQSGILLA